MKPLGKADARVRSPEFTKGNHNKNLGAGKSQTSYYKGMAPGYGKDVNKPTIEANRHITHPIKLMLDRYKQAKDPLRRAMGVHASTAISPLMASKFTGHPDPKVSAAALKIAKQNPANVTKLGNAINPKIQN